LILAKLKVAYFTNNSEKTGWYYLLITSQIAHDLGVKSRKGFRVKGYLGDYQIKQVALLPDGKGDFILPLNQTIRKNIKSELGKTLEVRLEIDHEKKAISNDLLEVLSFEAAASDFFNTLAPSHKLYFSKWIEDAKTIDTKTKRLSQVLFALENKLDFGKMIRHFKSKKDDLE
jgi:hypothetical protein